MSVHEVIDSFLCLWVSVKASPLPERERETEIDSVGVYGWMCMCMCACEGVYACMHTHTRTHTHIHIYIYIYISVCGVCVCVIMLTALNINLFYILQLSRWTNLLSNPFMNCLRHFCLTDTGLDGWKSDKELWLTDWLAGLEDCASCENWFVCTILKANSSRFDWMNSLDGLWVEDYNSSDYLTLHLFF